MIVQTDEVVRLFSILGVDIFESWSVCQSFGELSVAFTKAKRQAKINHRSLAMKHHPDRGGDSEQLKAINSAWSDLQKISMRDFSPRKSALSVTEIHGATTLTISGDANPDVSTWRWRGFL